ncbi:hypothetical protein [Bacillus hominis]|uniref:hypothetical protein n=1 Tax=Bacillus hominis TaxID=2817478 RepID=UPI001BB3BF31|nr:hypothetical protein [Bacillus hominis]
MMMLFKDLFAIGLKNGTLTKDFFVKNLSKLDVLNGQINASNYESSGQQSARNLYFEFNRIISS